MDPITTTTATTTSSSLYVPASPSTSLQDLSAVAAAIALDMKPKAMVDIHQTQKLKKLVRRNASDKLKLIQMVHDNPILWDSRLPNFKGAEEEKNRAWEQIGKEFNAPGRRVARAFKSLRESYRRELAHVKIMGSGFKPKWSLYEAMDFLRDVIRERKGGSHSADHTSLGLNLSAYNQHLANNNNSNSSSNKNLGLGKLTGLHAAFNAAALNLSKCPSPSMNDEDFFYMVKPELDVSSQSNGIGSGSNTSMGSNTAPITQPLPAHQQQQPKQSADATPSMHGNSSAHNDSRVSSTRNDSSIQNTTFMDEMVAASSMRSLDDNSVGNVALSQQGSDEVEELEAIDADYPYPLILVSNSPNSAGNGGNSAAGGGGFLGLKRRRKQPANSSGGGNGGQPNGSSADGAVCDDVDDDEDDYDEQMLQQHRHLRQQQQQLANAANSLTPGSMLGLASAMAGIDMIPPPTVRALLNSKFGDFISAKLNSMEDTDADNLMNKILMLLVQQQNNEATK